MNPIYRSIKKEEAFKAAQIENICLDTAWSESQIASIPDYAFYIVAEWEGEILGCGSIYCIAGEGQIMNIAVGPNFRGLGIGKGLMQKLEDCAITRDCEIISLEVAENNQSAIGLYEKCGYTEIGRRKGFYRGIDAIMMEKKL